MRRRRLRGLLAAGLSYRGYRPSWLVGQLGLAAGLGLAFGAFGYLVLAAGGLYVPYWQLWSLATGWLLCYWLLGAIGGSAGGLPGAPPDSAALAPEPYRQVQWWEQRLSTTHDDPAWFDRVVRPRVAAVADERLRQRHGVRLTAEPSRVRRLLGDELYDFLTTPAARTPSPAELARLTTLIEEI